MESLGIERRNGVLIVRFLKRELVGEDLIFRVGRELYEQSDEAAAYGGRLLLSFHGVISMSSAMIGKLVVLNKRCRDLGVAFKMCEISPELRTLFPGGNRDA